MTPRHMGSRRRNHPTNAQTTDKDMNMSEPDFEDLPLEDQRATYEYDYSLGTTGTRFMDDLNHMFVTENCGGDLDFVIYDLDGKSSGFASLNPPEVRRLLTVLQERVASYGVEP